MGDDSLDLLDGTRDVLVLQALAWGARHGSAVARRIEGATRGDVGRDVSVAG